MMACKKSFVLDTTEIEGRLDPFYYKAEFLELEKKIKNKFGYLTLKKITLKVTDGSHLSPKNNHELEKNFITVKDLTHFGDLDLENCYKVSKKDFEILKNNGCQPLENDILFSKDGTIGKTYTVTKNNDFVVLSSLAILRPNPKMIIPKYFEYILRSDINILFIQRLMSGSALRRIILNAIKSLKIPLPPFDIQTQIVNIMDNAYKIKEEKEKRAKELLDFMDAYLLDALGIKLPEIKQETTFSLDSSEVFSGRLDPFYYKAEFVTLHKSLAKSHFKIMNLQQICEINRGGSPRPIHEYITTEQDGLNWIKIGDTKNIDKYIYQTKQKIKKEGLKHSRFVKEGDFILSNSMSFGRPYIMRTTGCIHDGWLLLRIKDYSLIEEEFLYTILNAKLIYMFFKQVTIGSVVENLNIDLVKKVKIPIPPLDIQNEIVKHFQKLRMEVNKLKKEAKEILEEAKAEVENIILGED